MIDPKNTVLVWTNQRSPGRDAYCPITLISKVKLYFTKPFSVVIFYRGNFGVEKNKYFWMLIKTYAHTIMNNGVSNYDDLWKIP